MTPAEELEIKKALNLVIGRTTDLFRAALSKDAWIQVLLEEVVALSKNHTPKDKETLMAELKQRQQAVYQKLLEKIEDKNPGRAAQLDNRELGETGL